MALIAGLPFHDVDIVGDLFATGLSRYDQLDWCGVYTLILPPECEVSFSSSTHSRRAGNVFLSWEEDRLSRKWVNGTRVIYIGLAGDRSPRSFRQRLRGFLDRCVGKTSINGPHKGGGIL